AARACGVPEERAVGQRTAMGKGEWLAWHDQGDLMMIGDGIKDSEVVGRATSSGTPAIDRPFIAARSDFSLVTAGRAPVRLPLAAAKRLRAVIRRNLAVALLYNIVTIALAAAGLMSPVLCAVVMPLSSISTVAVTLFSLSKRSSLWKSSACSSS